MKVSYNRLDLLHNPLKKQFHETLEHILDSSEFIGGSCVDEFEKRFAELSGSNHAISCANGTDALYIILKSLHLPPRSEVLVPAVSWISTSEVVSLAGLTPVFCDISLDDYNISTDALLRSITNETRAVIAVHLYGNPCNLKALKSICDSFNIYLIEDCAQAHLATSDGLSVGTVGIANAFSLFPGKNLGALGDAGIITSDSEELLPFLRRFPRHGSLYKGEHFIEGINSRLDSFQASVLNIKLQYLKEWTSLRRQAASTYTQLLSDLDWIALPKTSPTACHVWHSYVVRTLDPSLREPLRSYLDSCGIQTLIHYPSALPLLPCYKHLGLSKQSFPNATLLASSCISLPIHPYLRTDEIEYVSSCIAGFSP